MPFVHTDICKYIASCLLERYPRAPPFLPSLSLRRGMKAMYSYDCIMNGRTAAKFSRDLIYLLYLFVCLWSQPTQFPCRIKQEGKILIKSCGSKGERLFVNKTKQDLCHW
ncbi:Hypothetical predicted protein [Octopus vulgaris]|uniref:Uncharacterized protein n=1 Tax=Octopus vulgaris TaxID=6645 RepID=A0AA36F5K9_OCTVU|nr:Hypothetical predicted protein [Octopus vulgaris]